jgi:nucleoside-diphosphate-sugar epimerase
MKKQLIAATYPGRKKDDLILIAGAGGFIAGSLTRYFHDQGFTRIRAVDKKPLPFWYQKVPGVENLCLDLSDHQNCKRVAEGAVEVYNLAADMGGMGFIENFRVECLRSILINTHLLEESYLAGTDRYFFSSSACAWEKLLSEIFCQEYTAERDMKTFIARFHNVYGPDGTWDGGREKAPAALARKVIEAQENNDLKITIWGDGNQTRSFMFIDDCIKGIDMIMHSDDLIATPINLGTSELTSINDLVSMIEDIAGVKLTRQYNLDAPRGVAGRNSDNTFIQQVLGWEPDTSLRVGMEKTYDWIKQQYLDRKAGKPTPAGKY